MLSKKRRKTRPQDEAGLLTEALADLLQDQKTKERRRRRKGLRWPAWLDKRIVLGLALMLVVVIGDGVRRENQEFYATVTNLGGQVSVVLDDQPPAQPLRVQQKLEDRDVILTGPASWAELSFPDGSVVTLDAGTQFRVKLLEYQRGGGWRSRNFYVMAGRIFARVGENFGRESQMRVYTPACVAAVRGTLFSVSVDLQNRETRTLCADGTVEVVGFNGQRMFVNRTGDTSVRPGQGPAQPQVAPSADLSSFRHPSLNQIIRPEPWYKLLELTVTQTLDAPLTILGIGKSSWWFGCTDFARRTQAQESLRKIRLNLEGDINYPLWVNPATLEELNIKEEGGVAKLLSAFDGAAIESYRPTQQGFYISARARDRKRTRYEATQSTTRLAPNQD